MTLRHTAIGGIFDEHCYESVGALGLDDCHPSNATARGRSTALMVLEELVVCDSLERQGVHRQRITDAPKSIVETALIVVHGTGTTCGSAAVMAAAMLQKTTSLTGSMMPYEIANLDAVFNLGSACDVAQALPPSAHIAMHGRAVDWNKLRKQRRLGCLY